MSQVGNISISDAVPTARVFEPARQLPGGFIYEHRSGGVAVGFDKLVQQLRTPGGADGSNLTRNYKAVIRLELPILKTLSSTGDSAGYTAAPAVDYRPMVEVIFTIPTRASLAERTDLHKMIQNHLADTSVTNLINNLDAPY